MAPGALISYTDAIADSFGFESMQAVYSCTIEDALAWFQNGLMRGIVCSGPQAGVIWEGFVAGIELRVGQETRSITLDAMANRVTVTYTTVLGSPGTTPSATDTTSTGMYGTKDLIEAIDASTLTAASNVRGRVLALYKQPRASGSIGVATGDVGDVQLTITGAGWYTTLGWVVTSRSSTSTTSTTTQVGALLDTSTPGIGATNAFLSTNTYAIVSSGVSDTEFIAANTTYQEKIEALLKQGDSGANALAWGVYEGRIFFVEIAADADAATADYRRSVSEGVVRDAFGSIVAWWDVRPNRMYEVRELLDINPAVVAPDSGGRSYIARRTVSVSQEQISLTLEGRTGEGIDRIVARYA
jgi:hypothetical protein